MAPENELSETKLGLILAAERLFATQGIAATTIRQINQAAGQKNSSAIHYHFGSRDAILDAIVALRVTPANLMRDEMIKEARAEAEGKPLTSQRIAELLLKPSIIRFNSPQSSGFVHRFILHLRMDIEVWRRYRRENLAWSLDDLLREMQRARPFIPSAIIRSRFRSAVNFSMLSMAEIELAKDRLGGRFSQAEAEFRIQELLTMLVGILDAPTSPETVVALEAATGASPRRSTDSQIN